MQPVQLHVSVGADHQDAAVAQAAGEVLKQQQARLVCPVNVVQDQEQWIGRGGVDEEGGDRLEQAVAFGLRLLLRGGGDVRQGCPHLRDEFGDV